MSLIRFTISVKFTIYPIYVFIVCSKNLQESLTRELTWEEMVAEYDCEYMRRS